MAGHDVAAEQIAPVFCVFAKILGDKSLWGGERFVVNHEVCGTAAKSLVATEKIAGEGFCFLSTVEPITSDEQQHPDAGHHFVDEDLEGEVCKGVRLFGGEERMQAFGGRGADEFGGVGSEHSHPAIEAVAAVDVIVSDGLYGD